jgi:hypothetical protein
VNKSELVPKEERGHRKKKTRAGTVRRGRRNKRGGMEEGVK